jgi:hypothetical protein
MKLVAISVISFFVILFSFQNCQKSPHPDEINGNLKLNNNSLDGKIDLDKEKVSSLSVFVEDQKPVTRAGNTITIKYNKTLLVDLDSGFITESNDLDSNTANYCLTDDLKNELTTILNSAQICKSEPTSGTDVVCTQALIPAYAQIFTSQDQYDLGSASDGCGNNKVDLCGEQAQILKSYLANLKNQYPSLTCSE